MQCLEAIMTAHTDLIQVMLYSARKGSLDTSNKFRKMEISQDMCIRQGSRDILNKIGGGLFKANAKSPLNSGWKVLFNGSNSTHQKLARENNDNSGLDTEHSLNEQLLPQLNTADKLHC